MPYKIRANKKRASIPIRVVDRSETVIERLIAHPKKLIPWMGMIAVVVVIIFAARYLNKRAEEKAWALESEASSLFHDPLPLPEPIKEGEEPPEILSREERLQKSARLYDEILEKYPRTATAVIAQYESGNVHFELKEFDLAENRYRAFLEKYPEQIDLISLVHLKLAYLYQRRGDTASAVKFFRLVYETEGTRNRDQAGFELGRSLEKSDKKEEAKEIYQKISEDFSRSPWGAEAQARLTMLSPVAETDPTSPEETPEADPTTLEGAPEELKGAEKGESGGAAEIESAE